VLVVVADRRQQLPDVVVVQAVVSVAAGASNCDEPSLAKQP
jgi:hypothetical protein